MNGNIWGRDTVVEVFEDLYGDKCIVWQLTVLEDGEAMLYGYITESNYAANSKCIDPSSDIVMSLDAGSSEVPDAALDELLEPLDGVTEDDIIGYGDEA